MTPLARAAETIVHRSLGIRRSEEVVIVCDGSTLELAGALRAEAESAGAEATLMLMAEREAHGSEPPRAVAAALAAADVFIAPTAKSLSHTEARRRASEAGTRGATLPGVTADMLARAMSVDFDAMAARSRAVASLLDEASEAYLSCPRGSGLLLGLGDRPGLADDGDLTALGAFGNLPCGEGYIVPVAGEGLLFASSMAGVGLVDPPAELTVEEGKLAAAVGRHGERFLSLLDAHGPAARNLAELGMGTNERATLTGNVLEDEKVLGTVHVAFGSSAAIGGTVSVGVHLDCVVTDASLTIGETPVLEAGRFLLEP